MDPCHTPGPGDEPPAADVVGLQRARRTRTTGGRNGPRPDSDDDIRGTPRAYERRCAPELRTTSAIVGGLLALTMLVLSTVVLVRGLMMGGPAGLMLICGFVPTSIAVVLPILLLVAAPLRWRLRADAAGIHSRGALRTAHIPWPVSRAEIAVILERARSGGRPVPPRGRGPRRHPVRPHPTGDHPGRQPHGGRRDRGPMEMGGGARVRSRRAQSRHRRAIGDHRAHEPSLGEGSASSVAAQDFSSASASWLDDPGSTA